VGRKFLRTVYRVTVPGGVLLLASALAVHANALRNVGPSLWLYYPYVVFGAALVLSAMFNRSRLFFAVLVLSLADRAQVYWAPALSSVHVRQTLFDVLTLLLPLNLAALSFVRDRGIISPKGRQRMALIAVQIVVVIIVLSVGPVQLLTEAAMRNAIVPHQYSEWSHMSQPALLMFAVCGMAMLIYLLHRRQPTESGLFWTLIAVLIGLDNVLAPHIASIYFATAGLILGIAVLETSYTMAYRDELTQLPSRRALNESLLKLGDSYTLAMADVDHFKSFNDTHGHAIGDQVLQMIAARLESVPGGGKAFRYGGEEFCIVFPNKSLDEVYPALESVRKAVESSKFMVRGRDRRSSTKGRKKEKSRNSRKRVIVTVSIGAASGNGQPFKPDEVLRAADKALYRAKSSGRNCTVVTELVYRPGTPGLASGAREALSF
jgi:diguanylate cyclase (GGDEF)-like protein